MVQIVMGLKLFLVTKIQLLKNSSSVLQLRSSVVRHTVLGVDLQKDCAHSQMMAKTLVKNLALVFNRNFCDIFESGKNQE